MKKLYNTVWCVFLCIPAYCFTYNIEMTEWPVFKDTVILGKTYKCITNQEYFPNIKDGSPALPSTLIRISISDDSIINSITALPLETQRYELDNHIMPKQQDIPISNIPVSEMFVIDTVAYSSASFSPRSLIFDYRTINYNGDSYLDIAISPYQYLASQKVLLHNTKICINVEFSPRPNAIISTNRLTNENIGLPYYKYVVIAPDSLESAYEHFIKWKRAKGYDVGFVSISDILNNAYLTGDSISQLYDDAGKLRQYLTLSYNAISTEYVLLGGNYSMIPVRYGSSIKNIYNAQNVLIRVDTLPIPSDVYYSDLDGNWNGNHNQYYGEISDGINFVPEIYVGRTLCRTAEEVKNWVKKVLQYEIDPGAGNYNYVAKALFTQADQMQNANQANLIASMLPDIECSIMSETPSSIDSLPTYPLGKDVIDSINTWHYGLLTNFNHGSKISYGTATSKYADRIHDAHSMVCAIDSYDENDEWLFAARPEPQNGFDNLTNEKYPSIMYSISCSNMPFDNPTPEESRNLGEVFTCISKGGGPAYIGNTREGWVTPSYDLYCNFVIEVLSNNHIGIAEALSKMNLFPLSNNGFWCCLSHNLLGCPETPLWTEQPRVFTQVSVSATESSISITTGENAAGTVICISGYVNNVWRQFVFHDSNAAQLDTIPDDYTIVVTKKNYIPYIGGLNTMCYIQDEQINYTDVQNSCSTIYIGSDISPLQPHGEVIVKEGGSLLINNAEVNIINDFSVEIGGELVIQ